MKVAGIPGKEFKGATPVKTPADAFQRYAKHAANILLAGTSDELNRARQLLALARNNALMDPLELATHKKTDKLLAEIKETIKSYTQSGNLRWSQWSDKESQGPFSILRRVARLEKETLGYEPVETFALMRKLILGKISDQRIVYEHEILENIPALLNLARFEHSLGSNPTGTLEEAKKIASELRGDPDYPKSALNEGKARFNLEIAKVKVELTGSRDDWEAVKRQVESLVMREDVRAELRAHVQQVEASWKSL